MEAYLKNSDYYYNNSQALLRKKEHAKAGELLWGSIVEATKALNLMYSARPLNKHDKTLDLLNELCLQQADSRSCIDWKETANSLHANFYETFMEKEEFLVKYEKANRLRELILSHVFQLKD